MCESLRFVPYRQKDIVWKKLADDDFIARIELIGALYTLRVEQMNRNNWWACLYVNGRQEWSNYDDGTILKTAKSAKLRVLREINKFRKKYHYS